MDNLTSKIMTLRLKLIELSPNAKKSIKLETQQGKEEYFHYPHF